MNDWTPQQERTLLGLADAAVETGVSTGRLLEVQPEVADQFPARPQATFVTLYLDEQLNGCLGSIEPERHICRDVVRNAFGAAFRDPRFDEVTEDELGRLDAEISVLSQLRVLEVEGQEHLCEVLRPGVDGLVLQSGDKRGTFLPSVWEKIPEPEQFVLHLKHKAKIPLDAWPRDMRVFHYEVREISR